MNILFEDEHIIIVNKAPGLPVQEGKNKSLKSLQALVENHIEELELKTVQLGLVHRIDQPTSGIVIFAKTPEALANLNQQFQDRKVKKTYWAVVEHKPSEETEVLTHWLKKDQRGNKSFYFPEEVKGSKKAILKYQFVKSSDRYHLLEIELQTGRHHQIRAQLSAIGCPIKGDIKYGAKRTNKDGSIHLHAHSMSIQHPVSGTLMTFEAEVPDEVLWQWFKA